MNVCQFELMESIEGTNKLRCSVCGVVVQSTNEPGKVFRNCNPIVENTGGTIGNRVEWIIKLLRMKPTKPCRCNRIKGLLNRESVASAYQQLGWYASEIRQHTWAPVTMIKVALMTALLMEWVSDKVYVKGN